MKVVAIMEKSNHRGPWWLLTCDDGQKYSTSNYLHAGLAQRALDLDMPVTLQARSGWFYKDLTFIRLAEDPHVGGC